MGRRPTLIASGPASSSTATSEIGRTSQQALSTVVLCKLRQYPTRPVCHVTAGSDERNVVSANTNESLG